MDRTFMMHYYEMEYEEQSVDIFRKLEEYAEASNRHRALEKKLRELVGGGDNPAWKMYEECMMAYIDLVDIMRKESYLMGAQDREKMMR